MTPISSFPASERAAVRCFLADIDDTMTYDGKLPAGSFDALWRLHDAGIAVIPITGRPAGWCDLIARQWPVTGVVGENGAFVYYEEGSHLRAVYNPEAPEPLESRQRLLKIANEVYDAVPGTRPAKDQFSRLFDVAVDFREEPPHLELDAAEQIKSIFERHGAHAKISSIHVNAWFGNYDKLSMASRFLADRCDLEIDRPDHNRCAVFCGDSPNDEPMFAAFENSVGVANIRDFEHLVKTPPKYVTEGRSATGFVEAVEVVLDR